jgi:hypothetical protein
MQNKHVKVVEVPGKQDYAGGEQCEKIHPYNTVLQRARHGYPPC